MLLRRYILKNASYCTLNFSEFRVEKCKIFVSKSTWLKSIERITLVVWSQRLSSPPSTGLYEKTHKSPWWLGPWNLWNIFGAFRKCPFIPTFHHHTRCVTYCSHLCWMMRKSIGHGGQGIKMPGSIITNNEIWHSSAWKETKK